MPSALEMLYNVYVEQAVIDESNLKPRIKSGAYQAKLGAPTFSFYPAGWEGAGEPRVTIPATLYSEDGDRLGKKSFDVTWVTITGRYGVSKDSTRFVALADALGFAKRSSSGRVELTESVGKILEAVEDSVVTVFGREAFKVKVADLPPDAREKAIATKALDATTTYYLEADEDETYERFTEKGYKGDYRIFSVSKARKVEF